MQKKVCFKCGRLLPLDDFYKHSRMGDGHLNKCKECTKKDVKRHYERKSADESWVEKERIRGREKFKRLGYAGKFRSIRRICPEEANMSKVLRTKGYDTSGKEAHHWNYNRPYSVFLISRKAHKRIHLHLKVNDKDKYCYTEDGKRLENVDQAVTYFSSILDQYGLKEDLKVINL